MLFTHTAQYLLFCKGIKTVPKSPVFFAEALYACAYLAFVSLSLGVHRHTVAGLGEIYSGDFYLSFRSAYRVGSTCVYLYRNGNVSRGGFGDFRLLLAAEAVELAYFFGSSGSCIYIFRVGFKSSAYDLDKGHLSYERVGDSLENESCRGGVFVVGYLNRFAALILGKHWLVVPRRGKQKLDLFKHHIYSRCCGGGAAYHRSDNAVVHTFVDTVYKLLLGERLALEEFFHKVVVGLGYGL